MQLTLRQLVTDCVQQFVQARTGVSKDVLAQQSNALIDIVVIELIRSLEFMPRDLFQACLGEVYDWYQPDNQSARPMTEILAEISRDMQVNNKELIAFKKLQQSSNFTLKYVRTQEVLKRVSELLPISVVVFKNPDDDKDKNVGIYPSQADNLVLIGMLTIAISNLSKMT